MEDFKDPQTAREWDANPTSRNPTRQEQLDILLSVLASEYKEGTAILDVGFGTGIVEEMIFERIPEARVVGLDASPAMLEIAGQRLRPYQGQYEVVIGDITDTASIRLPDRAYNAAISIQTIHNVPDQHKKETFRFVHDTLSPGGLFLLLDRIAIDTPQLFDVYKVMWKRLSSMMGGDVDAHEGDTLEEHRRIVSTRGDQPATLEEHLSWLREAGFEVACLHLHANRALFAARRSSE